jgi:hypothetical protein
MNNKQHKSQEMRSFRCRKLELDIQPTLERSNDGLIGFLDRARLKLLVNNPKVLDRLVGTSSMKF